MPPREVRTVQMQVTPLALAATALPAAMVRSMGLLRRHQPALLPVVALLRPAARRAWTVRHIWLAGCNRTCWLSWA